MILGSQAKRKVSKIVGERSSSFDLARGRLVLLSGIFALAYIMVAARAIDLTVIQGNVTAPAEGLSEVKPPAAPAILRADITDRNGTLLATTLKTVTLYADPRFISSKENAAAGLVKIFPEMSYDDLLQKFQSSKRFISLKRDLKPVEQYKVLQIGEPGLAFQNEERRVYPEGRLAAHLVGYSSIDKQGLAGVERSFDSALNEGTPLQLTLDIRLQHALRREVVKAMRDFNAIGASGIIMDASNGEILAGVSLPDFDSNDAGSATSPQIFNRMTLGSYELGSVFKIFSTAAFLETHDVPLSATFDATEPLKYGKFEIDDYHPENRVLTIPEVFMFSSNIGAGMMGEAVGTARLKQFYEELGLLTPLDFEIREVSKPQVPNPWRDINTITAAYGHGIATSPMQVAGAIASVVNGGTRVNPHLVIRDEAKKPGDQIVSEKTAHRIRQLMRLVVTDGTGKKADVPGYSVGGKTGTAEKNSGGHYDQDRLISSFAAIFPSAAPRYVVYIVIDEPKGNVQSNDNATAGWVAAPAAARVVTSMAAILGLPPQAPAGEQDLGSSLKQYISVSAHE